LTFEGARTTYRQLWDDAAALGRAYRILGLEPGSRIVCHLGNRPAYLVALAGAWACGGIHVGADRELTTAEVERVIRLTGASVLMSDAPPPSGIEGVQVIVVGDETPAYPHRRLDELLALGRATQQDALPEPLPEDPAVIFISSGTTGTPKATVGFHGNLAQRWPRLAGWLQFSSGDVHLAQLPLTHGFGLMMTFAALLGNGRVVLQRAFRASDTLDAIAAERITVFNGTPTHFRLVLRELERSRRDVRSLRLSAGTAAAFPPALVQRIWDELGAELVVMYGSSEGVGVASSERNDILLGAVGRPQPGSTRIMGPDGQTLPAGSVGEIAFSRRVYPVRYWRAESPEAVQDDPLWFRSGDLGKIDDDGRLYVLGRLKTQIDRGGLKVDPVEVERALLAVPNVADAAVIGIANEMLGEIICACVVPAFEPAPTLDELRWSLGGQLASYKLPDELCVLASIPRRRARRCRMRGAPPLTPRKRRRTRSGGRAPAVVH